MLSFCPVDSLPLSAIRADLDERLNPCFLNGRGLLLPCGVFFRIPAMFENSAGRLTIDIGNCQAEILFLTFAPHLVYGLLSTRHVIPSNDIKKVLWAGILAGRYPFGS
jgi:hypothetical protein